MRIVIALGGNALLRRGERPDAAIQSAHLAAVAPALAAAARDHEVLLVHGNGPQVGLLATESAADPQLSAPYPLDGLVAETQGLIGYLLQQALGNAGVPRIATLVTRVEVDPLDPALEAPTKFIGAAYTEAEAETARTAGWTVAADGARWRRVVGSPAPLRIVELDAAVALLAAGFTVVVAGGGGIAVGAGPEGLTGVEAVIDKDLTASLLAEGVGADLLVILTDVEAVMTGFGTPEQEALGAVTADQLDGSFWPAGSMGPKVAAASRFVRTTGRRAAIGSLDDAGAVIAGTAGTQISRD